ncbi:helix-turn-helix transcriptional regulator [Roseibium sp. TrichSKD4]|uniref:helix-turn-helix domain-containing protein n=1 Tax=Roseibium sp. TrichSKD4 TaxID=744980 RepID=UPI00058BCE25
MPYTKLRSIRTALGLSQEAVAQQLGTTQATISRLESGVHSPRGMVQRAIEQWIAAKAPLLHSGDGVSSEKQSSNLPNVSPRNSEGATG